MSTGAKLASDSKEQHTNIGVGNASAADTKESSSPQQAGHNNQDRTEGQNKKGDPDKKTLPDAAASGNVKAQKKV